MEFGSVEGFARVAEVLLVGGVGVVLQDIARAIIRRKHADTPQAKRFTEQAVIEKTLLNMAQNNEELTDDLSRVRKSNVDLENRARDREMWWQTRWDDREDRWSKREAELEAEVDAMRRKMISLIDELDQLQRRLQLDSE